MQTYIKTLLETKFTSTGEELFKEVTLYVRDIPYGSIGSRNSYDVLSQNMGTCSGKHFLLKEIYEYLGYKVKDGIAIHNFNDLKAKLTPELQGILDLGIIPDPHNFLKVELDGEWIDIDITWDVTLGKLGFETNQDWDGKSNMRLCVVAKSVETVEDGLRVKEEFVDKLDKDDKERRKLFIEKLGGYLKDFREGKLIT